MDMDTPLSCGKLPPEMLSDLLSEFVTDDDSFLVKPGIGEDTAAVFTPPEGVLVLKSDPITFATDRIGYYSVLINANDIATSGAVPRWFLVTLLLPPGTKGREIREIMGDLSSLCRRMGIILCGGHTEVTDSVNRPVVSGTLIGAVDERNLVRKTDISEGDAIILTKGVSVEGTSILCREFGGRLSELGMSPETVGRGKEFLSRISILEEARIAAESGAVTGMHDVTEGGLAGALSELSEAVGREFLIRMEEIPVYEETAEACSLLEIDPLGLIGSGSLIICCRRGTEGELRARIEAAGIDARIIGEVGGRGTRAGGSGVRATRNGTRAEWPVFRVDELARLFEKES